MADATTIAAAGAKQGEAGPLALPVLLMMMDVLQARGRTAAAHRMVDEIYAAGMGARGVGAGTQASR